VEQSRPRSSESFPADRYVEHAPTIRQGSATSTPLGQTVVESFGDCEISLSGRLHLAARL
jgi:hypothetical protein